MKRQQILSVIASALVIPTGRSLTTKIFMSCLSVICLQSEITAQPLDTILRWSADRNPNLQALNLYYEAALEEINAVGQLPDPTVGVGVPIQRPETRLGAQVFTIGITQMFPWRGTLQAKEEVTELKSKTKFEEIKIHRLDLFHEIRTSYYQLQLLEEKQNILRRFIANYQALKRISLAKVESGKASSADVLQVELKINEITNKLQVLENNKSAMFGKINALANQPAGQIVIVDPLPADPAIINYDLGGYLTRIKTDHPMLLQIDWKIAASKQSQMINNLSSKPTFGVGLDYSLVQARTDVEPNHNGRDILIPRATVSVPIFQDKFRSIDQIARLEQEAASKQKQSLENEMIGMLQKYKSSYDNAILTLDFARQQTQTIQVVYNLLLAEYTSKDTRFDELIQLNNQQINFEIMIAEATSDTYVNQSLIDRLTIYQ